MRARAGGNPIAGWTGRDILSLQQADSGALFAGTNHGIFSLASLSCFLAAGEDDLGSSAGMAAQASGAGAACGSKVEILQSGGDLPGARAACGQAKGPA